MKPFTTHEQSTALRPPLLALTAAAALFWLPGCTRENPAWCASNADCEQAAAAGEIPATHRVCNDFICFAGCQNDSDCQGADWVPGLRCNKATRTCYEPDAGPGGDGSQADGGSDSDGQVERDGGDDDGSANDGAPTPDSGLALGQTCTGDGSECASSNCLDGVCCKTDTCGLCQACNVDGQEGQCAPKPDDSAPDAECLNETSGCQGRCDGAGACAYDTSEVCANDDSGCQGTCNNEGGCTFDTSQVCKEECGGEEQGEGPVLIYTCETDGTCGEEPTPEDCAYSVCVENPAEGTASCPGDCSTHDDCINGSLCDRTELQLDASGRPRGQCIDPSRVVAAVDTDAALAEAITAAPGGPPNAPLPVVQVLPSSQANTLFKQPIELPSGKRLFLIADSRTGEVILRADSGPAIRLNARSELAIQGLTIKGTSGGTGIGIRCEGGSDGTGGVRNNGTLSVIESAIQDSETTGILATFCDVAVRRSTIDGNKGGGLRLSDGNFSITNSLIVNNGLTTVNTVGGVNLSNTLNVVFVNNTVAGNRADGETTGGVTCGRPGITLYNTILADNDGGNIFACDEESTESQTTLSAACNLQLGVYKPATSSTCIDGGNNDAVTNNNLVADREGEPRIKSGAVDIGAFEVQ
jgi:hypothetical protein